MLPPLAGLPHFGYYTKLSRAHNRSDGGVDYDAH